jgi:heme-degrading monooxygenase HmoA
MVLEQALLHVRAGQERAFEEAIRAARPLIAASPGFLGIEVLPAVERIGMYLLLVQWESIADHRDGFRQSERYEEWRRLLHGFYEPMPDVIYFGDAL